MTEVKLTPEQEAEKAKLAEEGAAKVKALEERLAKQDEDIKNLTKGIEKLAEKSNKEGEGEEGGEEGDKGGDKQKPTPLDPVTRSVYMKQNPELELVMDDVKEEAERLGVDPIQHYEQSKSWKIAAKETARIAKEKVEAQEKIEFPDGKPGDKSQEKTEEEKMEEKFEKNLPPGME